MLLIEELHDWTMSKPKREDGNSAKNPDGRVMAKDVAAKLGISSMTVSRVMNKRSNVGEQTRTLVLEAARELGYSPNRIAKSLVLRRTNSLGVVVPEITHSFFPEAIRGMEEVAYQAHFRLILMHSAESAERERDAILTLESERVDGILISMAQTVEDYQPYRQVIRLGVPIVFFDRCVQGIGASCVSLDDDDSAFRITNHVIDHGYTRIAHLSGPQKVSIGRERLRGFKRALSERGLQCRDEWIVGSGFQEEDGYVAMKALLALSPDRRPRAVVAVNDPAAFGAFKAVKECGLRIPEDIALVGFSDDIRAELMPTPLTTIRQPAYEVGKRAIQKLIGIIEGESPEIENIVLRGEEVLRESCGPGHRRCAQPELEVQSDIPVGEEANAK
ncbi:MAG: LacI family DNA-binding transcriptional regulator [Ignavibacteriales bacterium]|nr:LacI family DNA-binding transcriptional regulator [Ignavibacteriales bacterium]